MKIQSLIVAVLMCGLIGCSGPKVQVVELSGTVMVNGNPIQGVRVIFSPDPEKECFGRSSDALTDENGKYRLKYKGDSAEFGAEVGWHRITIMDVLKANSRDNPIPARIARKYSDAGKTDLAFEVKPGESQTFDFELEPRK